ncbi:phosphohydrolase [Hahella sp. CCB-MM4]|uniref:fibronectin type III domain-containing protein n=1 Tax=Hahella sp. (strain CCB-MM4) TaxID=1926491 RepID=UPI000B9C2198|nr:fibronectin type III domain-containing protein [Hahella sp. CCB-MM4]OZG72415.1 phosphohydrolase [Hahella sp. CCB-MM4]
MKPELKQGHSSRSVWIVLIFMLMVGGAAQAEITPYLQSPTETSIWVSWKTADGTDTVVEYGTSKTSLNQTVSGGYQSLKTDYLYHSVQLTELQPDTLYYYRARTGSNISGIYRFKTPPVKGTDNGHVRVLVMGDHQIRNENRYEQLVNAAKNKLESMYGTPVEESINLILNDGDQVDVGTLDHYENLHFAQSAALSPYLPIMTTVGNHEYYYDGNLANYSAHFIYDGLSYQGIQGADDESYYAYQIGRVLFVHMNSMKADAIQQQWLTQVVAAADKDTSVDWIISVLHHPYQAEQYVGDISKTLRESWMSILSSTRKHVLNIGGHHHLYARGQTREWPTYHMISGGTAWDQYWGQSTEEDFDDVQKTISNWAWQVIDIDIVNREMSVETYSEAHPIIYKTEGFNYHSRLIDSFHRKLDGGAPMKPAIKNVVEAPVQLPYTFESTPFGSLDAEQLNSTQFQIASDGNFENLKVDRIRDYENIFGDTGAPLYEPVDIHKGVNILNWEIPAYGLANGDYFIRVRHRDRNTEWSEWSDAVAFSVQGSSDGDPELDLAKTRYQSGESIEVTYSGGRGNPKDWIGIYRKGQTPKGTAATQWKYVPTPSGTVTFDGLQDGEYFVGFFENDGYSEIAERVNFYVGPVVDMSSDKSHYAEDDIVTLSWSGSGAGSKDWIGIYRVGDTPGSQSSTLWKYTPAESGSETFGGLAKGYYFASFFINDGYAEVSDRVYFSVGEEIAEVTLAKTRFEESEDVTVYFSGGPGIPKDYIGVFEKGAIPGQTGSELVAYLYFDGAVTGNVTFTQDFPVGEYFLAMYTNDSYDQVSNRACFVVGNINGCGDGPVLGQLTVAKDPVDVGESVSLSWSSTPGNAKDWIGIYKSGDTPGETGSTAWQYLNGNEGSAEFSGLPIGDYFAVVLANDGYEEVTPRVSFSVVPASVEGDVNGDGVLDLSDRNQLRQAFGLCEGDAGYQTAADLDSDGCVSMQDYRLWLSLYRAN